MQVNIEPDDPCGDSRDESWRQVIIRGEGSGELENTTATEVPIDNTERERSEYDSDWHRFIFSSELNTKKEIK